MNVIYAEIQTSDKTKIRVSTDTVNGNTFFQSFIFLGGLK